MAIQKMSVIVTPSSKVDDVTSVQEDLFGGHVLRVRTMDPPRDGMANRKVVSLLASYFGVGKSDVRITSGLSAKKKIVAIVIPDGTTKAPDVTSVPGENGVVAKGLRRRKVVASKSSAIKESGDKQHGVTKARPHAFKAGN